MLNPFQVFTLSVSYWSGIVNAKATFSDISIPDRVKLVFKFVASKKGESNLIIQEYVKEKFPLAYDYFESYGWKYCPISYKNLWGWKKQLEKGSLGRVFLLLLKLIGQ